MSSFRFLESLRIPQIPPRGGRACQWSPSAGLNQFEWHGSARAVVDLVMADYIDWSCLRSFVDVVRLYLLRYACCIAVLSF